MTLKGKGSTLARGGISRGQTDCQEDSVCQANVRYFVYSLGVDLRWGRNAICDAGEHRSYELRGVMCEEKLVN